MKKVINGRLYNTDTAKELATYDYGSPADFSHFTETLYRKRNGEYFIYGEGGPASRYAQRAYGDDAFIGGEKIVPMKLEAARKWGERALDGDEYEKIFGRPDEDGEMQNLHVQVDGEQYRQLKDRAVQDDTSVAGVIRSALGEYLG